MKVGLVLGAGGIQGGAWLTGGLDALAERDRLGPGRGRLRRRDLRGLDDRRARAPPASRPGSWSPTRAGRRSRASTDARGRAGRRGRPRRRRAVPPRRAWPPIGPGSWRLALRTLTHPTASRPPPSRPGWLPRGSSRPRRSRTRSGASCPSGWSPHPNLWIVACDYATGRRVAFGRADSPDAELADAVAASCAIPGFYHPVKIAGRRYVDGGIYSDVQPRPPPRRDLDLVICLNPTSSLHPIAPQPARRASTSCSSRPPAAGSAARRRSCAPRHRRRADPAARRGPRGDGAEPDEAPATATR